MLSRAAHLPKSVLKRVKTDMHESEWFVNSPTGKIAVVTWGDSRNQPVIMCHGKLDSAVTFRPLIEHLPKTFYYVALDLPGNGKSDSFPKGLPLTVFDFVYTMKTLVDFLQWDKFSFIGHSLGSYIGRFYHLSYPKQITRLIDLDPTPAYTTYEVSEFQHWYKYYQSPFFDSKNYAKFNASRETSPKYTYDKLFELVKKTRGLTDEAASVALERVLRPVGDGLFQLTFDQRMKLVTLPPFSSAYLREIYTSISEPILTILAENSINEGFYHNSNFLYDKKIHKSKNYYLETVEGNHDVHLNYPERIAAYMSHFLSTNFDSVNNRPVEC